MNKISIIVSWLTTHPLVYIAHFEFLQLVDNQWVTMWSIIPAIAVHRLVALYFNKVYMDIGSGEECH